MVWNLKIIFRNALILFLAFVTTHSYSKEVIDGLTFVTRKEYHASGKPCACPSDPAARGRCGKRAALCRNGGAHILDCKTPAVKSLNDYKRIKAELCGVSY